MFLLALTNIYFVNINKHRNKELQHSLYKDVIVGRVHI